MEIKNIKFMISILAYVTYLSSSMAHYAKHYRSEYYASNILIYY